MVNPEITTRFFLSNQIVMKLLQNVYITIFVVLVLFSGCAGEKKNAVKLPDTSPEEVIVKFFDLLQGRGRLASEAAFRMVSQKYGNADPQTFRKWTERYSLGSEIKPVETIISGEPNKKGDWIASVKLEISTPSMFGDAFKTISRMNLILDQDTGEWKIDFFAETIDEEGFRTAPGEALAEVKKGNK